jgi:hypothetical protein
MEHPLRVLLDARFHPNELPFFSALFTGMMNALAVIQKKGF